MRLVYYALKKVVGPTAEDNFVFEWAFKKNRLEAVKGNLTKWLAKNNHKKPFADGKVQKLAVNVGSIEEVVTLWNEFWS